MDEKSSESQQQPKLVIHQQLQATQKQQLAKSVAPRHTPVDTLGIDTAGGFGLAGIDDPTLDI